MTTRGPQTPAAVWAATVSHRRYTTHRHELDALLVAMDPGYERLVEDELARFEAVVARAALRDVERHPDPETGRPLRPRRQRTLFWVFVLSVTSGFAIMIPAGKGGVADFPDSWWPYGVALSSVLIVIGVGAQLLRGAPLRRRTPPVTDVAWLPVVLGIPTVAVMELRLRLDIGVDRVWVVLTGAAVAVSFGYCLLRWVQRRRDPKLTRQIDASEVNRIRALRDDVRREADVSGERIARGYAALPDADRDRIAASLAAAQATLRRRGFLRELVPGERLVQYQGKTGHRRLMVPGFLLLSRKVPSIWHPRNSVPGRLPAARWIVGEMEPEPARRARARVGARRSR